MDLDIAIVGMSCRFPGADSTEGYWQNIRTGTVSLTRFTDAELRARGVPSELLENPAYVKAGSILRNIDLFDADFFGISPGDASAMDPQQRIACECAWECLEDAACRPDGMPGPTACFFGSSLSSYLFNNLYNGAPLREQGALMRIGLGNDKDFLPTRLSYLLGLQGPSMAVQSACSSSLVAVHLAVQSLLLQECYLALVGGVAIGVTHDRGYLPQEGGILSVDGLCRSFDAGANGTLQGSGLGVIALKRLADAERDGDNIRAIIRASAVNNDGGRRIGFTVPGVSGQTAVIRDALAVAGLSADTIGLVEAHGSGTLLGDPIEVRALTEAFRVDTERTQFCTLGSVKSNIGHLDAAAGIAGLIKVVLALQHRELPPTANFTRGNDQIDFASSPFLVRQASQEWQTEENVPRRAGISSFGMGGTNAHVVLEEYTKPGQKGDSSPPKWSVVRLSAKSGPALAEMRQRLQAFIKSNPKANLADMAFTTQVGRLAMPVREAVICSSVEQLHALLDSPQADFNVLGPARLGNGRVGMMFPGVGDHYSGMGFGLYSGNAVFREEFDRCREILSPLTGIDIKNILFSDTSGSFGAGGKGGVDLRDLLKVQNARQPSDGLEGIVATHSCLFAVEYALARMLIRSGTKPSVLVGYSLGEYVAATIAGVFSLEDILRVIGRRALAIRRLEPGALLAVVSSGEQMLGFCGNGIYLSAENGRNACVVGGLVEHVAKLRGELDAAGISYLQIDSRYAFHTPWMAPIESEMADMFGDIKLHEPDIPMISSMSGLRLGKDEAINPAYWATQLSNPVRFHSGLCCLLGENGPDGLMQMGPGYGLTSLAAMHPQRRAEHTIVPLLRHRSESSDDMYLLSRSLALLWANGCDVRHKEDGAFRKLALPTYPFQRKSHWISPSSDISAALTPAENLQGKTCLYTETWRQVHPLLDGDASYDINEKFCLVYRGEDALSVGIERRLKAAGIKYMAIERGESFRKVSDFEFKVNFEARDDFDRLVDQLSGELAKPWVLIHLAALDPLQSFSDEQLENLKTRGFYGLLFLAQALAEARIAQNINDSECLLYACTNGAYDVSGLECECPEKGILHSGAKVLAQEYPFLTACLVDLAAEADPRDGDILMQLFCRGAGRKEAGVPLAIRRRKFWRQRYELMEKLGERSSAMEFPGNGIYLLVGGLGGIGLEIAEALSKVSGVSLVFASRTAFPPREQWEDWVADHPSDNYERGKIERLLQFEKTGARVFLFQADVSNEDQMVAMVGAVRTKIGPPTGVIHCAGVPFEGLAQFKTRSAIEAGLSAKVAGMRILERCLDLAALDLVVLCSSIRGVVGGPGTIDYCTANRYLDGYARSLARRSRGRVVSINWDNWLQVGMSLGLAQPRYNVDQGPEDTGPQGLTTQIAMTAFARALRLDEPQVVICVGDLAHSQRVQDLAAKKIIEAMGRNIKTSVHGRPNLQNPYVVPSTERELILAGIWQKALGLAEVGIDDNFFALGGDSVIGIQIVARVRDAKLWITPRHLFEHPTVRQLALAAKEKAATGNELAPVSGPVPLLANQYWFFGLPLEHPSHWGQVMILAVKERLPSSIIRESFDILLEHHDGLRLMFARGSDGWNQKYADKIAGGYFSQIQLDEPDPALTLPKIARLAEAIGSQIDIASGAAMKVVEVIGAEGQQWLVVAIHRLVADIPSWRMMLQDLDAICTQLVSKEKVFPSERTTSFKRWAELMHDWSKTDALARQLDFWREMQGHVHVSLPVQGSLELNFESSRKRATCHISKQATSELIYDVPKAANYKILELLMAVFGRTVCEWMGEIATTVTLEGHGRDELFDNVDLTRTVGWFTSQYPIKLAVGECPDDRSAVERVAEVMARLPDYGLGFGPLRYMAPGHPNLAELRAAREPEIIFVYLGNVDAQRESPRKFVPVDLDIPGRAGAGLRPHVWEFSCAIASGRLACSWDYSENLHSSDLMEKLLAQFKTRLEAVCQDILRPKSSA